MPIDVKYNLILLIFIYHLNFNSKETTFDIYYIILYYHYFLVYNQSWAFAVVLWKTTLEKGKGAIWSQINPSSVYTLYCLYYQLYKKWQSILFNLNLLLYNPLLQHSAGKNFNYRCSAPVSQFKHKFSQGWQFQNHLHQ